VVVVQGHQELTLGRSSIITICGGIEVDGLLKSGKRKRITTKMATP
jgi:hypothetical protein